MLEVARCLQQELSVQEELIGHGNCRDSEEDLYLPLLLELAGWFQEEMAREMKFLASVFSACLALLLRPRRVLECEDLRQNCDLVMFLLLPLVILLLLVHGSRLPLLTVRWWSSERGAWNEQGARE